jgi:tetratricopeptide (TPR) repeat protein
MTPAADILFQQALALDARGHEKDAIPLYRNAIRQGLSRDNFRHALIGLGSSLRAVGQTSAAIRILRQARREFPRDPAIILFLALAHSDAGQHKLVIRQLADLLLNESEHPSLAPYRAVLKRKFHSVR